MKKIHGHTKIQFFAQRGEVIQTIEKDNTITDAVANILSPAFVPDAYCTAAAGSAAQTLTPVWSLFAGVLCSTSARDEAAVLPGKAEFSSFTANAGGTYADTDTQKNVYRGTFSADESEIKANSLKLVFNFGLNKCPGNIGSISLTSVAGGAAGLLKPTTDALQTSFFSAYGKSKLSAQKTVAGIGVKTGTGTDSCCIFPYIVPSTDGYPCGNVGTDIITVAVSGTVLTVRKFSRGAELNFTDEYRQVADFAAFQAAGGSISALGGVKKTAEWTITSAAALPDAKHWTVRAGKLCGAVALGSGQFRYFEANVSGAGDSADITKNAPTLSTVIAECADITDTVAEVRADAENIYAVAAAKLFCVKVPSDRDGGTHTSTYAQCTLTAEGYTPIPWQDTVCLWPSAATTDAETYADIFFLTSGNILARCGIITANASTVPAYAFITELGDPVIGICSVGTIGGTEVCGINADICTAYAATVNNLSSVLTKYATTSMKITYTITMTESDAQTGTGTETASDAGSSAQ